MLTHSVEPAVEAGLTGLPPEPAATAPDVNRPAPDQPRPDMPPHEDRLRDAARAVAELRRGAAVVVRDGRHALAVAAAETVAADRLADLRDWTTSAPLLIRPVAPGDGSGDQRVDAAIIAWRLAERDVDPAILRRLADPALGGADDAALPPGAVVASPPGAAAAIALAKLGQLLPTLIAAALNARQVARAQATGAIVAEAADIAAMNLARRHLIRVGEAKVPLEEAAEARLVAFRNPESGAEHLAIVIGRPDQDDPNRSAPLVRLHSECFTGDVLGSLRCDCGPQLRDAIRRMAQEGSGVVLYLAQEGRGIGLLNKLRSYVLQDQGLDTLDANAALGWGADERDFGLAATMLRDLGLQRVRLLTNNPAKVAALAAAGIAVERASLLIAANGVNDRYLATKAARFGHLL